MIKINKNLLLFSGVLLLLGGLFLLIFHKFAPLIGHAAYYCQSFINTHMIPIPYYLSIIPALFLIGILSISGIKFFILLCKIHYLKFTLKGKTSIDGTFLKRIKKLGLEDKIFIIQSNEQLAFCLGIRVPKIYISTGLISELTLEEIEVVLRHEQYHLENHDTFTMMIASLSHSLFPFFPLLGDLIKQYRVEREIAADMFATTKVGSKEPLISALKKLLAFPTAETLVFASIAEQDTLEPRIYSLLNKHYQKKRFHLAHLIITIFSSLVIGAILIMPVHAKELHHEEHDVVMVCAEGDQCMYSCMSEKNLNKLYSEIPNTQNTIHQSFLQPYSPAHQ